MRRPLVIALAVLVPFALLVWVGLGSLSDEPGAPPPTSPKAQATRPATALAPTATRPPVVAAPSAVAPVPPAPAAPPPTAGELQRAAVLEQLTPVVNVCFLEMNERLKREIKVSTSFVPSADGTLGSVAVTMASADPYLVACVQDALEGARLDPARGWPAGVTRHTFTFGAPAEP